MQIIIQSEVFKTNWIIKLVKDLSVLILGSGPNALEARGWLSCPFDKIVAINNAWAIRKDWDDLIYAYDFPKERRPNKTLSHQRFITQDEFVPVQNKYGGFLYAGGTMAFTAGYWALGHYKPSQIAFLGCDMHYPENEETHFYGKGTPDPLRKDISLRSLEAKANRFYVHAVDQGCILTNLSRGTSRLTFPRQILGEETPEPLVIDTGKRYAAMDREKVLNYFTASGKYWEELDKFDEEEIAALDELWLGAVQGKD